jgi:hypothetical protein
VLYLGFSIIQIVIDLFRGQQNSAFLKVIVMIVFTILLNQLCIGGLTILSWFIVFIPFILMTYVTTILLYVFGLNPSKGKHAAPDPRRRHKSRPHPRPYNPQDVGGCAGTEFGCCPDGVTASNVFGSNCYGPGPSPQPGPQPQPSPQPPHHHHHHHYSTIGWNCGVDGKCVQTPNGKYDDEMTCNSVCGTQPQPQPPQPSMGWNCGYGGKCVQTPNGKYGDEMTCNTACKPSTPMHFACENVGGSNTCVPSRCKVDPKKNCYASIRDCNNNCKNNKPPTPPTNTYNCVPNASGNDRHCEATKGGLIGKYKSLDECNQYCKIVG